MESLTAFKMPRMEESASCRSSAPSQPLLYFSISCGQTRQRHEPSGESAVTDTQRPTPNLEKQLVFGDPLNGLQQVGIQAQFVLQLFLTFLVEEKERKKEVFSFTATSFCVLACIHQCLADFWLTGWMMENQLNSFIKKKAQLILET